MTDNPHKQEALNSATIEITKAMFEAFDTSMASDSFDHNDMLTVSIDVVANLIRGHVEMVGERNNDNELIKTKVEWTKHLLQCVRDIEEFTK